MNDHLHRLATIQNESDNAPCTERKIAAQQGMKQPQRFLRTPWIWALLLAASIAYLIIRHGLADADNLPKCQSPQVTRAVVDLLNRQIRENPLAAMVDTGIRAMSIASARELHAEPAFRACEGVVQRNNGKREIGYTIEMAGDEKSRPLVDIHDVDHVRALYAKPKGSIKAGPGASPTQTTPAQQPLVANDAPNLSDTHAKCMALAATMLEMIQCSDNEVRRQNARLNLSYRATLSAIADKEKLQAAQQQWVRQRDKECVVNDSGGQNATLVSMYCIAIKTTARANELDNMR